MGKMRHVRLPAIFWAAVGFSGIGGFLFGYDTGMLFV
jgi:hypothetical protein